MRRAARVDSNQQAIVRLLRQLGCHVWITSEMGHGAPDLVVSHGGGHTALVELKDGSLPPSARRLTGDEAAFRDSCRDRATYVIVETEEDAISLAAALRGVD